MGRPPDDDPGPPHGGRRGLVRGLAASAAAVALAPLVAASRPRPPGPDPADLAFDETYRGRRIHGAPLPAAQQTAAAGRRLGGGAWRVTVDGRPLHLMRRADGGWLSVVDHYASYDTPLAAARAAVDALGPGQRLRAPGGGHHGLRP
ncbi:tyrosinase family oxidase copper chaperone [Streptomyces sp. NPDC006997]|uniref:tyrosinase family oxidase copper chaperone n=1 Tax=Streptomyces sp. NPDC006997 TaxID=3155356 RepID=UPI0033FD1F6B